MKFVGEVVADLKRQELSDIDLELLRLKRTQLEEKLRDFQAGLVAAAKAQRSKVEQDLFSRGLGNSSLRQSAVLGVERDASNELEKATREYSRAIEEIALLERKVAEERRPLWQKVLRWCGLN